MSRDQTNAAKKHRAKIIEPRPVCFDLGDSGFGDLLPEMSDLVMSVEMLFYKYHSLKIDSSLEADKYRNAIIAI